MGGMRKTLCLVALSVVACGANSGSGSTATFGEVAQAFEYPCTRSLLGDVRDINHDGRSDVVVGCGNTPTIGLGQGNGGLALTALSSVDYTFGRLVGLGFCDADGDEHVDVCAVRDEFEQGPIEIFSVWQGRAGGSFSPEQVVAKGKQDRYWVYDVDGDASDEVVAGGTVSRLTLGGIQPIFQTAIERPRLVDLDGDGVKDVVGDGLRVALGAGPNAFREAGPAMVAGAFNVHAADLDGDGKIDLTAELAVRDDEAVIFVRGLGDGSFSGLLNTQHFYAVDIAQTFQNGAKACVLATPTVRVFCAQGDFDFTNVRQVPVDFTRSADARVADLNGDGRWDVVVVGWDASQNENDGRIRIGLGR